MAVLPFDCLSQIGAWKSQAEEIRRLRLLKHIYIYHILNDSTSIWIEGFDIGHIGSALTGSAQEIRDMGRRLIQDSEGDLAGIQRIHDNVHRLVETLGHLQELGVDTS